MADSNLTMTKRVASNIRAYSAKRRISQSELADKVTQAGVPMGVHTVRSIVGGRRRSITVDEMAAFATALECDVYDMVDA